MELQGFFGMESPTRLRMFELRICESKDLKHSRFFDSDFLILRWEMLPVNTRNWGRGVAPGCPLELLGGPAA